MRAESPVLCIEINIHIFCPTYTIIIIVVVDIVAQMRIPSEVFGGNLACVAFHLFEKICTLDVSSQSFALVDFTRTEVCIVMKESIVRDSQIGLSQSCVQTVIAITFNLNCEI